MFIFQSTLPARGATDVIRQLDMNVYISIHAPREGSDPSVGVILAAVQAFQSTLPARGATGNKAIVLAFGIFQSTLPARGATEYQMKQTCKWRNFNPRSPRGERP